MQLRLPLLSHIRRLSGQFGLRLPVPDLLLLGYLGYLGCGADAVHFHNGRLVAGHFDEHESHFLGVSRVDAKSVDQLLDSCYEFLVFFHVVLDSDFFPVVDYPLVELVAEEGDASAVVDGEEEGGGCGADSFEGHEGCDSSFGGEGVGFVGCEGGEGGGLDGVWGVGFCELEEVGAEGAVFSGRAGSLV